MFYFNLQDWAVPLTEGEGYQSLRPSLLIYRPVVFYPGGRMGVSGILQPGEKYFDIKHENIKKNNLYSLLWQNVVTWW